MEILLNNKSRIVSQWYKIFSNSRMFNNDIYHKHWKKIEIFWKNYKKNKNNKYLSLKNFFKYNFIENKNLNINLKEINKLIIKEKSYKIIFINGIFIPHLSDKYIGLWKINTQNKFTSSNYIKTNLFLYLTEIFSKESIYITLSNKSIEKIPLYLIHFNNGLENKKKIYTSHSKYHIEINNKSKGTIIEHFIGLNSKKYFNGSLAKIFVNNDSRLNYITILDQSSKSYNHYNNNFFIKKNSLIKNYVFILNSGINFFYTNVKINKKNSKFIMNTLSLISKKNNLNFNTYVEHNSKNSLSKQLHKIIGWNNSIGLFNGLIRINKSALKSNAKMINNNLIIDNNVNINSKPKLEIYNDNVKCSHGSTFGNINDRQIFYLISRGISKSYAKKMIIQAFIYEIISKIDKKIVLKYILSYIDNFLIGV